MAIVNLGILAHVDAGKTTLTERILFETGVISALGSVDRGTTQTDTMELERARGITIRAAVASFCLGERVVNLIDTPGHADFIAEVERSLGVLDGVILVVSAVEGAQPQTRRLVRAIRAAGLPIVVFINKIDRLGARGDGLPRDLQTKLALRPIPITTPAGLGSRDASVTLCDRDDPAWRMGAADLLAETSERVIAAFDRAGAALPRSFIESEMRAQIAAGEVVPVFFGSAITGAGVPELLAGVAEWLPVAEDRTDAPLAGTIFKIARRPSGEKIVYVRLFSGCLAPRQRIVVNRLGPAGEWEPFDERVTAIDRFVSGAAVPTDHAGAGDIVCLHGLRAARIGDRLGESGGRPAPERAFPAPTFESAVEPVDPGQLHALRTALETLAEQDPLIGLRQRNDAGELSVRLYGEVQKEVIAEMLANEHGVAATFGPSRTICVERPIGVGDYVELITDDDNPYHATLGFRIEPSEIGGGVRYVRELGSLPPAYYRAVEETVHETLLQGVHGWEVTDCLVTLTQVGYSSVVSTAADFRKLAPLVLTQALLRAGVDVCEPIETLELTLPADALGAVCAALVNARAILGDSTSDGATAHVVCEIPAAEWRALEPRLPRLTRGEGDWSTRSAGYAPVIGDPPCRPRVGPDPRNRALYHAEIARG